MASEYFLKFTRTKRFLRKVDFLTRRMLRSSICRATTSGSCRSKRSLSCQRLAQDTAFPAAAMSMEAVMLTGRPW